MAGSTFGTLFRVTTFGESHGQGLGAVIDGCPAGLCLSEEDIQIFLDRRKPGQTTYATPRKEADKAEILSGVFEGKTTGTPIAILVRNMNQRSKDYSEIAQYYRPGHADFCFDQKYGFRDYRGGGRSSGRETIGRVMAGAVASKILKQMGIHILTYTKSIGPHSIAYENFDKDFIRKSPLCMPDPKASSAAESYLQGCIQRKDSSGGLIECVINGLPAGIGEPVFDKVDAELAKAIFSIGSVKGFEIGDGFESANSVGSENNDPFQTVSDSIVLKSNHCGGTLGGMTSGSPLVFRAAVKPTPSIGSLQHTVKKDGSPLSVTIEGRHDPVIVPRAVVVVESMAAITLLDLIMRDRSVRISDLLL